MHTKGFIYLFILRVIHFNNQRQKRAKKSHGTVFKITGLGLWGVVCVREIPLTKRIRKTGMNVKFNSLIGSQGIILESANWLPSLANQLTFIKCLKAFLTLSKAF